MDPCKIKEELTIRRKCFLKPENQRCSELVKAPRETVRKVDCGVKAQSGFWGSAGKFNICAAEGGMSCSCYWKTRAGSQAEDLLCLSWLGSSPHTQTCPVFQKGKPFVLQ